MDPRNGGSDEAAGAGPHMERRQRTPGSCQSLRQGHRRRQEQCGARGDDAPQVSKKREGPVEWHAGGIPMLWLRRGRERSARQLARGSGVLRARKRVHR